MQVTPRLFSKFSIRPLANAMRPKPTYVPSASTMEKAKLQRATFSHTEQYRPDVFCRRNKSIEGSGNIVTSNSYYMPERQTKGTTVKGEGIENNLRALLGAFGSTPREPKMLPLPGKSHSSYTTDDLTRTTRKAHSSHSSIDALDLASPARTPVHQQRRSLSTLFKVKGPSRKPSTVSLDAETTGAWDDLMSQIKSPSSPVYGNRSRTTSSSSTRVSTPSTDRAYAFPLQSSAPSLSSMTPPPYSPSPFSSFHSPSQVPFEYRPPSYPVHQRVQNDFAWQEHRRLQGY